MKLFIKLDNPAYKFCPPILQAKQHMLVTYRGEIVRTIYDIRYDLWLYDKLTGHRALFIR